MVPEFCSELMRVTGLWNAPNCDAREQLPSADGRHVRSMMLDKEGAVKRRRTEKQNCLLLGRGACLSVSVFEMVLFYGTRPSVRSHASIW